MTENDDIDSAAIAVPAMTVIESQERANIDMLVATAKRYPRDLDRVQRKMENMATRDLETAESCTYHLERDGHAIEGPSVRMAEIAVSCYQNIRAGTHVVGNDGKVVTAQGFCHDTENNTFVMWEVQRRITDKRGRTYTEDMQVTTAMAAAAIAYRNAVFKVIPSSLVKSVEDAARKYAVGDLKTLANRRTRLLRRFAALGVREATILQFLQYESAEQITVDDVERLIAIGTAIREETTTIEETFGPAAPEKPNIPKKKETTSEPPDLPPPRPSLFKQNVEAPTTHPRDDLDMSPPGRIETLPEPSPMPVVPPQPSAPPPPQPPTKSPAQSPIADQIAESLADDGISEAEFLAVADAYNWRRDPNQTLRDITENYLKVAKLNWGNITEAVARMRRGEEP